LHLHSYFFTGEDMTNDEIIEMARQVCDIAIDNRGRHTFVCDEYGLEAFAKLVAQHEREACAKVCDDLWKDNYTAYACAEAIRARGKHD
jgi:hypothetical protein